MTEDTIKNLIKLTRDVDDAGNLSDAGQVVAHIGTTKTFTVTVASKTSAHRYNGSGSGNGYVINGVEAPYIELLPDVTYQFDQSDSSNSGHPLLFYLEADKTTQYSTGVTTNGTPGSAGAYTQIAVTDATPVILYYQCSAHAFMGNAVSVENKYIIDTFVANNYAGDSLASNTFVKATFTSNNSLNTRLGGFTSNNSLNTRLGGFVSNNFFQDNSGGGGLTLASSQYYGSGSGTYTVPAGVTFIAGAVYGGGGGGGGASDNQGATGGTGGRGGAAVFASTVTPGATYSYSIGSGGNRGQGGNYVTAGGAGGASNFGSLATANGGNGGGPSTNPYQGNSGNRSGNADIASDASVIGRKIHDNGTVNSSAVSPASGNNGNGGIRQGNDGNNGNSGGAGSISVFEYS